MPGFDKVFLQYIVLPKQTSMRNEILGAAYDQVENFADGQI